MASHGLIFAPPRPAAQIHILCSSGCHLDPMSACMQL
uniref:Uncharacterized protein n=1 Tax=Anguilla anguilla TaxID=7936 RepID=A0A0E9W597_ANGAN